MSKKKPDPWTKPRDVWSDDKLLDELGRANRKGGGNGNHPHPGGKPPNRSCAVVMIGGAAGLSAAIAALSQIGRVFS